ncbi:hypothetical protein CDD81_5210 [Ophiocordyceps australis]|uniref:Ribosomal protein S17 n=1 Tax=Ophiocordyceps australis TaxID=1399860 RepID=A0A2C5XQ24_9HYPO|nr:hypothetical protein CDD81_5210 [Ophiocordyceps australis]
MSSPVGKAALRVKHQINGVVVSAGLMQKTAKWFTEPKHYLVHDPNSSLRTGDVVSIVPGWPTSQHKRHLIKHIIAPFGTPIEQRPPIPTLQECIAQREAKKAAKDERRAARAIERQNMKVAQTTKLNIP